MRRTNWKTVSTLVTMVVIAGCQDNVPSAPAASSSSPVSIMMAPSGSPTISMSRSSSGNNTSSDFTVTPAGGTFRVGNVAVVFPANSICDPATSSYGPGTWDSPCSPLTSSITIHAVVRTAKLGTWVDFSPALRFVPSASPKHWVWIYFSQPGAVGASDVANFGIGYAARIGAAGVNEALTDGTLRTYVDTWTGFTLSRVKHFSGYTSSSGKSCDPNVETDCYPDNGGGSIGGDQ